MVANNQAETAAGFGKLQSLSRAERSIAGNFGKMSSEYLRKYLEGPSCLWENNNNTSQGNDWVTYFEQIIS